MMEFVRGHCTTFGPAAQRQEGEEPQAPARAEAWERAVVEKDLERPEEVEAQWRRGGISPGERDRGAWGGRGYPGCRPVFKKSFSALSNQGKSLRCRVRARQP